MSLDVTIKFKEPRMLNYYLEHPYIYDHLTKQDETSYYMEDHWSANITHNLGKMASNIPVDFNGTPTTLYYACWRPEEIGAERVSDILPMLIQGIHYMVDHRKELVQFNAENGWGTYEGFMKFLLNYKQACEDADPNFIITTSK